MRDRSLSEPSGADSKTYLRSSSDDFGFLWGRFLRMGSAGVAFFAAKSLWVEGTRCCSRAFRSLLEIYTLEIPRREV